MYGVSRHEISRSGNSEIGDELGQSAAKPKAGEIGGIKLNVLASADSAWRGILGGQVSGSRSSSVEWHRQFFAGRAMAD